MNIFTKCGLQELPLYDQNREDRISDRFRLPWITALFGRGLATLTLIAGAALLAPSYGFSEFEFLNQLEGDRATNKENRVAPECLKDATRNWMGSIPNSVKLHNISIPGTHESAAFHYKTAECQVWRIPEQLNAGIRYLDIRVRRHKGFFSINHGLTYQKQKFSDVMKDVNKFLDDHPSETVLMRVQETSESRSHQYKKVYYEGGCVPPKGKNCITFGDIWESEMQAHGVNLWDNGGNEEIPSLGQVRGKIVVLRSSGGIPDNWGLKFYGLDVLPKEGCGRFTSSTQEVQDCFKVSKRGKNPAEYISWKSKNIWIQKYINKADSGYNDKLILNHLSGVSLIPQPIDVARETNLPTYGYIGDYVGKRTLGILIMDFPGPGLVYRIVKSNRRPPSERSITVGGEGGGDWESDSESAISQGNISQVRICHGKYIDSIKLYYAGEQGATFGGPGGDCDSWQVPSGELIEKVTVGHGKFIDSLRFVTDKGSVSDFYGGSGGIRQTIAAGQGETLRTVRVKSGKIVDSLEVIFCKRGRK